MKHNVLFFVTFLLIIGCAGTMEKELERATSPDKSIDAVLVAEMHGGAAGSVTFSVYIVAKGKNKKYKSEEQVFEATGLKGHKLSWLDKDILEIKYSTARILHFRNYIVPTGRDKSNSIEIRETPLTPPPSFEH